MGMYTRMVFNAELVKDAPVEVIDTIKWLVGDVDIPDDKVVPEILENAWCGMFQMSSSYHDPSFTSHSTFRKMDYSNNWGLSVLCDIKNYWQQFETFIAWVTPYIDAGCDPKKFVGYTIYEEAGEPDLIYIEQAPEWRGCDNGACGCFEDAE